MKRSIAVKNKRLKYEQAEKRINILQYEEDDDDDERFEASCKHKRLTEGRGEIRSDISIWINEVRPIRRQYVKRERRVRKEAPHAQTST